MTLKLYAPIGNMRANLILIVAELAGLPIEHVNVEYTETKTKEHLERNPVGKVPVLQTAEGYLFETNTILRYLARASGKLYGKTTYQQGLVDQFIDFAQSEVTPAFTALFFPIIGHAAYDKETYFRQKNQLQTYIKVIEQFLSSRKYLAGEELTIADISLTGLFFVAFKTIFDEKYRKTIPHIVEWFGRVSALPQFVKYQGRAFYTQTEWPQPQPQTQVKKPAPVEQKKQAPKEKESPKKATKKEQSPNESPKKKEEKPAVQHKFDIYNFKTLYTNAKDKNEAVKFLVENWHEDDQCVYFSHYEKYEGEGKILYQFNNQKNGFLQRSEAARKVAFGTYSIYGDEPNLEIKGVWLFQGTEVPESMKENPQFEYHKWQKLNIKDAKDLQTITNYWTNTEDDASVVDGQKLRSFATFK